MPAAVATGWRTPGFVTPVPRRRVDVALAASDPGLSLLKEGVLDDANDNDVADVGETVTYTFTVTNTGDTPLTGVTVDDPRLPTGITPATQDLPFGAVRTFTGTYTVTQADIDAGSVLNTATASGDDPTGTPVDSLESTDEIPTPDRDPELSLVKTGRLERTVSLATTALDSR